MSMLLPYIVRALALAAIIIVITMAIALSGGLVGSDAAAVAGLAVVVLFTGAAVRRSRRER